MTQSPANLPAAAAQAGVFSFSLSTEERKQAVTPASAFAGVNSGGSPENH